MEFHDNGVAYGLFELASVQWSTTVERQCYITVNVYGKRDDYGGASDGSYDVSAPGFSPSSGSGYLYLEGKSWKSAGSYSGTVTTDANGVAYIGISATIGAKSPSKGWFYSTATFGNVDCGTPPSLAGASRVSVADTTKQMGKKLLISIDRDDAYCTHTLEYSFGSKTGTIGSSVASSKEWTVPDLAAYCNNSTSGRCTITCYTYRNGNYLGSDSCSVTLTVPDPTQASVNGTELTMGSSYTIGCSRKSSNFKIELSLSFQNSTSSIWSGNGDSYNWTPPYSLAKKIESLIKGSGNIVCKTFNGTALVGEKKTPIWLIVPENDTTRPKVTDFTMEPVSTLPSQFDGLYMRGKTGIKSNITATATYSAIADYRLAVGNNEGHGNPATVDIISEDGTVKVTATVTDKRGFTGSKSKTITVIPYSPPKVVPYTGQNTVICDRATQYGALDPKGTYLAIKAGKKHSSVMLNGVEQNGCQLRYRWKQTGQEFCPWMILLGEDSPSTEVSELISNIVTSLSHSYTVELSALDKLGSEHKLKFTVMTEAVSFVLYDGVDGAAFGKYPEGPHIVEIAKHMTLIVHGPMVVAGEPWYDAGLWEGNGIKPSVFPHGRHDDTGCSYRRDNGNHVRVAFNCAFTYRGNPVEINARNLPAEYRPPREASSICAVDEGFACCSVKTNGAVVVDWVQKGDRLPVEVNWIDGYIDYFTE